VSNESAPPVPSCRLSERVDRREVVLAGPIDALLVGTLVEGVFA
jgi:hypothetical protein